MMVGKDKKKLEYFSRFCKTQDRADALLDGGQILRYFFRARLQGFHFGAFNSFDIFREASKRPWLERYGNIRGGKEETEETFQFQEPLDIPFPGGLPPT